MQGYILLGIVMRIIVDALLLLAAGSLAQRYCHLLRAAMGAAVGGIYAAACMVPRLWFLCGGLWYAVAMSLICLCCFGMEKAALYPAALFCLLRLAMDGLGSHSGTLQSLFWAAVLAGVCLYGFHGSRFRRRFVPVELRCGEKIAKLQGLYDTGNSLRDPITGRQVLVVGADVADRLTGLTPTQLARPVETVGAIPGLRLIPYKTVGQSAGLMLAMQLKDTRIGKWKGSTLVAFAPQVLDEAGTYQALIGGAV